MKAIIKGIKNAHQLLMRRISAPLRRPPRMSNEQHKWATRQIKKPKKY